MPLRPAELLLAALLAAAVSAGPGPFGPFDGRLRKTPDGRVVAQLPQGTMPHDPTTEQGGQEHASFLLALPSGELLMAWFTGRMEAEQPMATALSRLPPNGTQWSATEVIPQTVQAGYSNQNPVLVFDEQTGLLHLFHPSQAVGEGQANSTVVVLTSADGRGLRWSDPAPVFTGRGAFVRGAALRGRDGAVLLPMYYTPQGYDPMTSYDYSAVQRSSPERAAGEPLTHWSETLLPNSSGLAQPSVVRLASGELRAFFRDRFCGSIHVAASRDDGRSWDPPTKTVLPNNNCGIWAAALRSGAVAAVFNNAHIGRTPLTIGLSYDGGRTWPFLRDLESEPLPVDQNCTCGRGWSPRGPPVDHFHKNCQPTFAYPTIMQTPDGALHVSYDHNRQVVVYQRVTEEWVRGGARSAGIAQPAAAAA